MYATEPRQTGSGQRLEARFPTRERRRSAFGPALLAGVLALGCQTVSQVPTQFAQGRSAAAEAMGDAGSMTTALAIRLLDAPGAPDAGFLQNPERMRELDRKRHPFHRAWVAPDHDRERYTKVLIAPVDIDHQLEISRWNKLSTASFFGLEDDVGRLAIRLREKIEEAFRNDPKHRFEVVTEPDSETLVVEIALVAVVPNKSVLALGALAAMAAPVPISIPLGTFASRAEHGYVAIEGRVRDGGSGKVVAMFADRESSKTRVLDLQSIHWYGHTFEIFDEWATQLVEVANRPMDPGIPDPTPFTLKPW